MNAISTTTTQSALVQASDQRIKMQKAIFLFGLVEMCAGLLAAISADFVSVFNVLTFFAGICGIVAVLFCVTFPASVKLYDVLGWEQFMNFADRHFAKK